MDFSSLDILYIVLAFCVLWFTAAMFWLIWQVAAILRNINDIMDDARNKMHKIEQAITAMKERMDHASTGVKIIGEGLLKIVDYAIEKKRGAKRSSKTSKSD